MNEKYKKYDSFYICHRCMYMSHFKNDITKHYNRKNICDMKYTNNEILTIDEYKERSLTRRYYIKNRLNYYPTSIILKIITQYKEEVNYIDDDIIENVENKKLGNNKMEIMNITEVQNQEIENIQSEFVCLECGSQYKKKESYLNHMMNKRLCLRRKIYNSKMNEYLKNETNNNLGPSVVNNIQNNYMSNVQHNYNNYNSYNLKLKDFLQEGYSLDHIVLDKLDYNNFFLYDNMLNLVFDNDENKNIYFENNNAVFYTKNNISVLPNDKAVYILLEKMGRAANKIINMQEDELRESLNHVKDYYRINLNKYKFDTLYRKYDPELKKFIYDSDVPDNMRTRDECIQTTMGIINNFENKTQEIFKSKNLNTKKLTPIMPYNIEDYVSIKDRYKELKDE